MPPPPATSDNTYREAPKRAVIRRPGGECQPGVTPPERPCCGGSKGCTIVRPTATKTFAGKGTENVSDASAAPVPAQGGVALSVRCPDRQGVRARPRGPGVPPVCGQACGGRDPGRTAQGVSPDAVQPRAAARDRADPVHRPAAPATGGIIHPQHCWGTMKYPPACGGFVNKPPACRGFVLPRRYPVRDESQPLASLAAHTGGGHFLESAE